MLFEDARPKEIPALPLMRNVPKRHGIDPALRKVGAQLLSTSVDVVCLAWDARCRWRFPLVPAAPSPRPEILRWFGSSKGQNMLIRNWWKYSLESSMSTHNALITIMSTSCIVYIYIYMHTYRKTLDAHTLHKHTFSRSLCKYVQSYHINIIILKPCVYYPCGMPVSYQISSLPTNSSVVTMECAASRSSSAKKIRPWRSSTFRFSESFRRAALPKVPAVVE